MEILVYIFLIFFIYSVIGYLVEISSVSLIEKKMIFSRGYLIGPYLPIFGFGSVIITLFLNKYQNDIVALFIMAMFFCCTLEYFTSFFLEKIFKLRWWNYKDKKYNLNGRICLETGIMFGLGGIVIEKVTNPLIFTFLNMFSITTLEIIAVILFLIIVCDFILSTYTIIKLEIDTNKYLNQDATMFVKEEVRKSLQKYRYFHNRFFKAFPAIPKSDMNIMKIREIIDNYKNKK